MSHYQQWGFTETPFQTRSLSADQNGEELLVGRDSELRLVNLRIQNMSRITTVEGANGVGKTSLINVAAYQQYEQYLTTGSGPLILPCRRIFQLNADGSTDEFVFDVVAAVAQTLIERETELAQVAGKLPDKKIVDKWLNQPIQGAWQASLLQLGFGAGAQVNQSSGYERVGFQNAVFGWLEQVFPSGQGGVLCVIDNLELLQTTDTARQRLEELRDLLLLRPGLVWLLCGSNGIMRGPVSSARLSGHLLDPVQVPAIPHQFVTQILSSRFRAFAVNPDDAYLPLRADDFQKLYDILLHNTRDLLGHADNYCMYVADQQSLPKTDEEKADMFGEWLAATVRTHIEAAESVLSAKEQEAFFAIADMGGTCSPGDYARCACNNASRFSQVVSALQENGFVSSQRVDGDLRKKCITLTPKGALAAYAKGYR